MKLIEHFSETYLYDLASESFEIYLDSDVPLVSFPAFPEFPALPNSADTMGDASLFRELPGKIASHGQEISELRFASILVARGGADPLQEDERGEFPAMVALKAGRLRLASLLSHYGGVQASITLLRVRGSSSRYFDSEAVDPFGNLAQPLVR